MDFQIDFQKRNEDFEKFKSYFVNFLILCMIFLYCAKIKKSGIEYCSWHYGVSKEKIQQIKKIIKE